MNSFVSNFTDKHTVHSYLEVYEGFFSRIRESCTNLMEIGVETGGSIKLWNDYFPNAIIYGLDVNIYQNQCRELTPRVRFIQADAYTSECAKTFETDMFDVIIDDGPHSLESHYTILDLYYRCLKPGGYMIIEDIQDINHITILKQHVDAEAHVTVLDRRSVKGRYDDIMFVVQKPTNPN
jgi:trans-aconitate methyltransferase